MKKLHALSILMIWLGVLTPGLHAQVPVVDSSSSSNQRNSLPQATYGQTNTRSPQNVGSTPAGLLYQLEILQQEVQSLRGIAEEQAHQLNQMREEQRDRYLDLDRRISGLNKPSRPNVAEQAVSNNTTKAPAVAAVKPGLDEKKEYQAAFELIRSKRYDDAIVAFSEYVKNFPSGSYTGNAYYWLGEVQVVRGNHKDALTAFGKLLTEFPQHRKIPDAKYKLGKVYRELGDQGKAKQVLEEVVTQHTGTSAAKLAEAELRNLSL